MTPSETENITHILVFIAIQIRVLMKMSRIGVAVKMGLTLCLGYVVRKILTRNEATSLEYRTIQILASCF